MPPKRRSPKKSRSPKKARASRRLTDNMYYTMLPNLSYPGPYYTPRVTNASAVSSAPKYPEVVVPVGTGFATITAKALAEGFPAPANNSLMSNPLTGLRATAPQPLVFGPQTEPLLSRAGRFLRGSVPTIQKILDPVLFKELKEEEEPPAYVPPAYVAEQYKRNRRVGTRSPKKRSPARKARTTRRSPRRSPRKTRR